MSWLIDRFFHVSWSPTVKVSVVLPEFVKTDSFPFLDCPEHFFVRDEFPKASEGRILVVLLLLQLEIDMFAHTVRKLFCQNTRRRNLHTPRFAAEQFEQRLQLSAVTTTAISEVVGDHQHSYSDDSDNQYPDNAITNTDFIETAPDDTIQVDPATVNAFPNTPQPIVFQQTDETNFQPVILQDETQIAAVGQSDNLSEQPSATVDTDFESITIPSLLDDQLVDNEVELKQPSDLSENEQSAADSFQDFADTESGSEQDTGPDVNQLSATDLGSIPTASDQSSSKSASTKPTGTKPSQAAAQHNESSAVFRASAADIDVFFADDNQVYLDSQSAAVLSGMFVSVRKSNSHKRIHQM